MARTVERKNKGKSAAKKPDVAQKDEEPVQDTAAKIEETLAAVRQLCSASSKEDATSEGVRLLSPLSIHFSQNHIRPEFQDGRQIAETAANIGSQNLAPVPAAALAELEEVGIPSDGDWWLLKPPFPAIEVIQWRIKLREEDGTQVFDSEGNELYGEREWYTLDNRRLYCLQKVAVALYPKEVRILANVVRQEDGTCREFRKFRSVDRGRSIRLGHRDVPDLPKWCWRLEVGLPEEVLPAGTALPRQGRRRSEKPGWVARAAGRKGSRHEDDEPEESSIWDFVANASLFVLVYAAVRLLFAMWRHYSQHGQLLKRTKDLV